MRHNFTLMVRTDTEAFKPAPWEELARILREAADRVEKDKDICRWFQTIRDKDENDVGRFALKHEDYKG